MVLPDLPIRGANTEGTRRGFPGYGLTAPKTRWRLLSRGRKRTVRRTMALAVRKHLCFRECPYADQGEKSLVSSDMSVDGGMGGREIRLLCSLLPAKLALALPCLFMGK